MNIRQLITFVTVAKTKNMAQTALALNYSHSTIYGHLESLEKEFNTKFYTRTSHGIELTERGVWFLSYAKRFVDMYYDIYASLVDVKLATLRIGASESSNGCLMNRLLREYIDREPEAKIEHMKMTSEVALVRIASGVCDLAIICEFNFHPEDVVSQYLGPIPLIFVTLPEYLPKYMYQGLYSVPAWPTLLGTMKMSVAADALRSVGLDLHSQFSSFSNIGDLTTIKQFLHYNRSVALLPAAEVFHSPNLYRRYSA